MAKWTSAESLRFNFCSIHTPVIFNPITFDRITMIFVLPLCRFRRRQERSFRDELKETKRKRERHIQIHFITNTFTSRVGANSQYHLRP